MKLDAIKFGAAWAIAAVILWFVCSLLVAVSPHLMLSMSGSMMHMQLDQIGWHLTLAGVVAGAIVWAITAGVSGWLVAFIYNRLL